MRQAVHGMILFSVLRVLGKKKLMMFPRGQKVISLSLVKMVRTLLKGYYVKYGPGNYYTGPGSEYNKIKKWGEISKEDEYMNFAYVLQHSYEVGEEGTFDETKLIGVYSSKEKAEQVMQRYMILPGFRDFPIECFHISEYEIDKDQWMEGFINWDEA